MQKDIVSKKTIGIMVMKLFYDRYMND